MSYPKTTQEWWALLEANLEPLRSMIRQFHPTYQKQQQMPITAMFAEVISSLVREGIAKAHPEDPMVTFDLALNQHDGVVITSVLNQTWFGLPESTDVHYLPGWPALCNLCSESHLVFEEEPKD